MRGCQKVQKFPDEFGSILAFFLNTRFYFIFDSRACNGGGAANPDLEYVRPNTSISDRKMDPTMSPVL